MKFFLKKMARPHAVNDFDFDRGRGEDYPAHC